MKIKSIIPGLGLAMAIALLAKLLANALPIHLISASVTALFLGMLIHPFIKNKSYLGPGLKFTSKKVLKFAIVLLGFSLSLTTLIDVGRKSLIVMVFTLATCFGGGYFIGKALKLDWKLSNLISAGTGICGGSAIAALAPVIEAKDEDVAYALSATFIFDMVMILMFPLMGHALALSDISFGLWAGTAVNDTSSVVAASYAFSETAGDFATMVKLTRTLSILPTVLIFSMIHAHVSKKTPGQKQGLKIHKIFPWFILAFVAMSLVNSLDIIPLGMTLKLKDLSKFLMLSALAAIGLTTDLHKVKKAGFAPMLHGFIISSLVVLVSILVILYIR